MVALINIPEAEHGIEKRMFYLFLQLSINFNI